MYTLTFNGVVLATQVTPILYDDRQKSWITDTCIYADTERVFSVLQPATDRHISVGAFFDRFGAFKYPILASTDATVKALIQDCSVRKYIDLDNSQLPAGLAIIEASGFAIDSQAILHAEITEVERQ